MTSKYLKVQEPPKWAIKPFDKEGIEADMVEFKCQALGSPLPKYSWVDWEGRDVRQREGSKVDEDTGTMTLFSIKRTDVGEYTCTAENNAGMIQATATLAVIIKPKVQELLNKTSHVGAERASLTCKASGDPLPKIIWRKWSRK